jgi:hypothetical protein
MRYTDATKAQIEQFWLDIASVKPDNRISRATGGSNVPSSVDVEVDGAQSQSRCADQSFLNKIRPEQYQITPLIRLIVSS